MFTIKVTYHGQTRKATFQDHVSFPNYFEITSQAHRLFPTTQGFNLCKLLFSPDASFASYSMLISKEVRSAHDYAICIRPYKDLKWPNALLRFVLIDTDSASGLISFDEDVSRFAEKAPRVPSSDSLFSTIAMDVDQIPTATSVRNSATPLQHRSSMASVSSCCSVSESKAEIKAMLDDFQTGLNRVLSSNLQEPLVVSSQSARDSRNNSETVNSLKKTPPTWCSYCTSFIASSELIWYCCVDCNTVVCKVCHQRESRFCPKMPGPHNFKSMNGPTTTSPSRPLPTPWTLPHRPCTRPASFVSTINSVPLEPRRNEGPTQSSDSSHPVIHMGVRCDACRMTIRGVRHKCLDCRDYDLCTLCITTGYAERHNPFHEFYEIREPGRVVVHTVFGDEQQWGAPARPARNDGPTAHTPPVHTPPVVHTANCDLCDSRISGDRYKCTICPDFDTCSLCFTITDVQHPNHSFVKVTKREDLIYRRVHLAVHDATCDACDRMIYGTRFKCMHPDCPDYDLCQNCEALPISVHPSNHPMLKMKTPETVVPTVYRVGQRHLIPFGSTTPTPGRRTDENIRATGSSGTPAGATRAATPTPASVGNETAVSMKETNDLFSSTNTQGNPASVVPKATSLNPFGDIFARDPPPIDSAFFSNIGMINPWPTTNDPGRGERQRVIAELSGSNTPGNTSTKHHPSSQVDESQEDTQMEFPERKISLERLFGSEEPVEPSKTVPEALPGALRDGSPAVAPYSTMPNFPTVIEGPASAAQSQEIHVSDSHTQKDDTNPGAELFTVRESLASLIRELPTLVPPVSPSAEGKIAVSRIPLSAAFVEDVTVPDGQVFPPGAEFVKCWRLINDSGCEWPESTELIFLAGDSLSAAPTDGIAVPVGKTGPGETIEVWTGELKAPEVPGRYVGYWRLRADGELFGNSLWVDINVVEADSHHSSEDSMAASSVIMPAASSAPQSERVPSVTVATLSTETRSLASVTDDNLSDAGSDMSLISMPPSPSDDEVWHEARSGPSSNLSGAPTAAPASSAVSTPAVTGNDYVLLYDDESDEERR